MSDKGRVCRRCLDLADTGKMRYEALMPLRGGALDALARDGSGPCCIDCEVAELLSTVARIGTSGAVLDFCMARVAVANARQEHLRLSKVGVPADYGLGVPLKDPDRTLDEHLDWLDGEIPEWRDL